MSKDDEFYKEKGDELYEEYFGEKPTRVKFNLNLIIFCWSIIWASFLVSASQINARGNSFLFLISNKPAEFITLGPAYIFLVWLSGCLILYLIGFVIEKLQASLRV